ncbi:carboxyltransferase domain-containing protein [Tautonia sp. JC769]|uniref:5-oxoprolinase subunit B family protein n=1 Tax=Tautonia sp. JC769 TaxID=3232135 RepID=UPI00345A8888
MIQADADVDLNPLGDRAWLARFPSDARAASWAEAVRRRSWAGAVEVVVAYHAVAVLIDPSKVDPETIEPLLRQVRPTEISPRIGREFRVPVAYEGEDLVEISATIGRPIGEIIAAHSGITYSVRAIGFLPGFPYLGELAEALAGLSRRPTPRTSVPAGSVAIAGRQTCIYPEASPGGWHLIGQTPLVLADLASGFLPLATGDRVRFEPIGRRRFQELQGCRLGEV